MCGIVGYVGDQQAIPILIRGLEHLEYRGYDSAGIACLEAKSRGFFVAKEKGKLSSLKACLNGKTVSSHIGIGHTRWATHGEPSKLNAHPHLDDQGRIALVHNGIIENFSELKSELKRKGFKFRSETDTEVAVNLISSYYRGDLLTALRQALARMHGFFAFAMVNHEDPNTLIVFKRSNPLVIGLGKKGNFIASDASALLPHTNKIIFLGDEEYALVQKNKVSIYNLKGKKVTRNPVKIHWNVEQAQKTGYPHFMLKEIYEQPVIMQETLYKRLDARGQIHFDTLDKKRNTKNQKK